MSDYSNLTLSTEGNILTITISRPESLNALNAQTISELQQVFDDVQSDMAIKGIIITGEGKAFVAGADITEIAELNALNGRKFSEAGQELFQGIEDCEKPVVAAVNGFALGGGCELAMACHLRIASEYAKFGLPEAKLGIIPGYGGTQRLTHLVGKGMALQMMLTGDMVDTATALNTGLVNQVTAADALLDDAKALLGNIFEKAPIAIANIIRSVNAATDPEVNGYQVEANGFLNCCGTQDFKEGTTAFLEKRKAEFKGE